MSESRTARLPTPPESAPAHSERDPPRSRPTARPSQSSGPSVRVLIADDNPSIRTVLRRVLSSELPVDVRECDGGLDAWDALQHGTFDLFLLDIEMGPLDGLDIMEMLSRTDALRDTPVVVITGAASEERVQRLKALGVRDVLAKPLSYKTLSERLVPLVAHVTRRKAMTPTAADIVPLDLRASSPVWLLGGDEKAWGALPEQLHPLVRLRLWDSAPPAIHAALTAPPTLALLRADMPQPFSATLVARAMRRAAPVAPCLVLCGASEDVTSRDDSLFDAIVSESADAPLEVLLRALQNSIKQSALARVILSAETLVVPILCDALANSLEEPPSRLARCLPPTRPQPAIESSAIIDIAGASWKLTFVVDPATAIERASRDSAHADFVSHNDALDAAQRLLSTGVWPTLSRFFQNWGLAAALKTGPSRAVHWDSFNFTDPQVRWLCVTSALDGTYAVIGVQPVHSQGVGPGLPPLRSHNRAAQGRRLGRCP